MATKAKNALVSAFLRLIDREDFDKITVTSLVEECSISRQTFYYHFDDIESMLKWAFENETRLIVRNNSSLKWSETAAGYVDFMRKYDTLMRKAADSKSLIMIYQYLYNSFYTYIESYISKKQGEKAIEKEETKFFIAYTASAFCGLVILELQKKESDYENLYNKIISSFKVLEK